VSLVLGVTALVLLIASGLTYIALVIAEVGSPKMYWGPRTGVLTAVGILFIGISFHPEALPLTTRIGGLLVTTAFFCLIEALSWFARRLLAANVAVSSFERRAMLCLLVAAVTLAPVGALLLLL
jgi:hypothetical protein